MKTRARDGVEDVEEGQEIMNLRNLRRRIECGDGGGRGGGERE